LYGAISMLSRTLAGMPAESAMGCIELESAVGARLISP
jgi:hypothetical protein